MLLLSCKIFSRSLLYVFISITLVAVSYAQTANSPKNLDGVEEDEDGYYYTVKKGDTLWGLSRKFFNSTWMWPDLWGKNKQLPNPHWIYPGQRIRLIPKPKPTAMPTEAPSEVVTIEQEIEEPPYFVYAAIDQIGFIRKEEVIPIAQILAEANNEQFINQGEKVYIKRLGQQRLTPGHMYTIYRPMGEVANPANDNKLGGKYLGGEGNRLGKEYKMVGLVEITKNEDEFDIGRIIHSYRKILVNDLLMPYRKKSPKITLRESQEGIDGQIIGTPENNRLIAANFIVFINRGSVDGIEVGQEYSVYEFEKIEQVDVKNDIGSLIVLHVEEAASTALITYSSKSMHPGDKFRTPVLQKEPDEY